jgi:tetratricopeptide (TPR) repeat protein
MTMADVNASSQDAPQPAASAGDTDTATAGSPFVTTTSVLESLNKALAALQSPDDKTNSPHFELQKKLPNGSTRRATTEEVQAADMESKLQQSAAQVEFLKTWDEKKQWAEEQRQYGNQLYREERYESAIDVYLTCLVVAQQEKKLAPPEMVAETQSAGLLFLYVMNNLAQSTLALKWFRKTEQFCTLALQEVYVNADTDVGSDAEIGIVAESGGDSTTRSTNIDATSLKLPKQQHQIAKLYYKRGKARRLGGNYKDARIDLETALQWIDWLSNNKTKTNSALENQDKEQEGQAVADSKRVVERELQLVAKAVAEARRNKERQQQAMKKVLSTSKKDTDNSSDGSAVQSATPQPSLFPEIKGKRAFSTLRAPPARRKEKDTSDDSEDRLEEPQQLTYSQWYLAMIGRVAQKLLEWSGDDEYAKRPKED